MGLACIRDGLCVATTWCRSQDLNSSAPLGPSAALRGHTRTVGWVWVVPSLTQPVHFPLPPNVCPRVPVTVEISAGVFYCIFCRVPAEADGLWQQSLPRGLTIWSSGLAILLVLVFEQTFEVCLPAALWTLWLEIMNEWSVKKPRSELLIQLWKKLA